MPSVLPKSYYYFFWLAEPILTIAGGLSAIIRPREFANDLLSQRVERSTWDIGRSSRGQILAGELGSCFMLLAMISLSLVYLFKKHLDDRPAVLEKMVKGLLVPLAIADLLHIAVTFLPLPISHIRSPRDWSHVLHCTIWITSTLFIVRVSWLLGIGRPSAASLSAARSVKTSSQRPIPFPKSQSELRVEKVIQAEEESAVAEEQTPRRRTRARASRAAE
ncbi:hypothetical protein IAU60_000359 [Kwoniella sp. DSM 27419]